uniref:UBC core domain-containing protein n=1 Tax=Anas platyrhynchos platyrhynchos TaxID=8840 RepID=A0A493T0H0_ANAPP
VPSPPPPPQELEEVQQWRGVCDLKLLEGNVLRWGGAAAMPRSVPQNNPPYNMGAFRFELTFSPHHPLEPPRARLLTSIYHPGVSKDGHVCQPLTSLHCWIRALTPPLTPRLARELGEQPETFWRRAEEHTRSHAEPRPQPPGS